MTFPFQTNYNLGSLGSTPVQRSTFLTNNQFRNDAYRFTVSSTSNLNIALEDIASGDDADLFLYRDSNGNGVLDTADTLVTSSTRTGSFDDTINYRVGAGTYFARVSYFSGGGDSRIDYNLDIAAESTFGFSRVVGTERNVGDLFRDEILTGGLNSQNTSDTIAFSLGLFEGVNIRLYGLSADADIRVIRDSNNNNLVDTGEEIRSSTLGSTQSELISNFNDSGDYILQISNFNTLSSTNYTVLFDHYNTPFA